MCCCASCRSLVVSALLNIKCTVILCGQGTLSPGQQKLLQVVFHVLRHLLIACLPYTSCVHQIVSPSPHNCLVNCRHPATWVLDDPQCSGHTDVSSSVIQEQIIPNAGAETGTMGIPDHTLQVCAMPCCHTTLLLYAGMSYKPASGLYFCIRALETYAMAWHYT